MRNHQAFDTCKMQSHRKEGYAAFTLNTNDELSVFNHLDMKNKIPHSSMNAGAPVVAAGEIKIDNGVLKAITIHSGHYRPSLFNVYRLLEYFVQRDVDISKANIITFHDPHQTHMNSQKVYYKAYNMPVYSTPAVDVYFQIDKLINESISSIHLEFKDYIKTSLSSILYSIKDFFTASTLTKERKRLARQFETKIINIQLSLENTVEKCEDLNFGVSSSYNKSICSGRLANKEKIRDIKSIEKEDTHHLETLKKFS